MLKQERYWLLDAARGIILISMLLYHTMWDIREIFGVSVDWYKTDFDTLWQRSIRYGFILLSGFCWSLGRHRLRRALTVLAASGIVTAVTAVFMKENIILFGVLTLLGSAMLIMIPLDKVLCRLNPYAGLLSSLLCFILLRDLEDRLISFFGITLFRLPKSLYSNLFTAYIGMPTAAFSSSDYVPLLPWIFIFLCGYFLYRIFTRHDLLHIFRAFRVKPLEALGRHSLIIYMLHQPIIYAVLYVIFEIIIAGVK